MGKTLAEQIAELTKPTTEFDIEDNELRDNVFENNSDNSGDDLSEEDEELQKQHYVKVNKSKLRKDDINLSSKYTGSISSRKDLYGDDEDVDVEEDEDDDEEEEEDEDEDSEDEEGDEDEDGEVDLDDSELDQDSDESQDEDADQFDEQNDVSDDDLSHKRNKLKLLLQSERKQIVSRLSQSASNDALKGYSVLQQHKFFDTILDSRIKLQKSITTSNQLPPNNNVAMSEKLYTKKSKKYLKQSQEKCFDLLDQIFTLRNTMLTKESISKTTVSKPKKRSLSEYLKVTNEQDSLLNKYRSAVLTKWSSKIQTSSGASALNAGKFKAINQTSEQQVVNNLSDMGRLIKRTKLNRKLVRPLGFDTYLKEKKGAEGSDHEVGVEEDEDDIDIPKEQNNSKTSSIAELDIIFDDEDFYRVLLSDLVDKKVQSSNPASGLTLSLASAQRSQKLNKNIETKASKGRKLRYHIQEPIANFEAPRNGWKWKDEQIDEFFASLLGQKVNMNEVDEDEDEEDEEEQEVSAGGIKLFG
ncbi:protein Bfr2p [[Candida] railenensis]|uniref:Protein BFR2 n=1 Tax=[Candida] railenensis TaxID=45579 RepID=A0A9P0VY25_9ASCO|nr:protein Bfr2p [[Candida] railenensis]